jgi:hypothetical protein
MSFMALLPNDLAQVQALLQSLAFSCVRFRSHGSAAAPHGCFLTEVRATALLALCHSAAASHCHNPNRSILQFSRLRVPKAFVTGPFVAGSIVRFRRFLAIDYGVNVPCFAESHQP